MIQAVGFTARLKALTPQNKMSFNPRFGIGVNHSEGRSCGCCKDDQTHDPFSEMHRDRMVAGLNRPIDPIETPNYPALAVDMALMAEPNETLRAGKEQGKILHIDGSSRETHYLRAADLTKGPIVMALHTVQGSKQSLAMSTTMPKDLGASKPMLAKLIRDDSTIKAPENSHVLYVFHPTSLTNRQTAALRAMVSQVRSEVGQQMTVMLKPYNPKGLKALFPSDSVDLSGSPLESHLSITAVFPRNGKPAMLHTVDEAINLMAMAEFNSSISPPIKASTAPGQLALPGFPKQV